MSGVVTVTAFQRGSFQLSAYQIADVGPLTGAGDWILAHEALRHLRAKQRPVVELDDEVEEPALEVVTPSDEPVVTQITEEAIAAARGVQRALTARPHDHELEEFLMLCALAEAEEFA